MTKDYAETIRAASKILVDALFPELAADADVDGIEERLQPIIREVGRQTEQQLLAARCEAEVRRDESRGLTVHRRRTIRFDGLYGPMEIESPYLWEQRIGGARPAERVGLEARGRSGKVERALTDFGAEESFGQAAKRFEEHYGWSVGRTSVLRVVESVALEAEKFVEQKLGTARKEYERPLAERPGAERILVEMDGCELRTGALLPAPDLGVTEVRKLPKRRRETKWRDVRMGLARKLDEVEPIYVGKLAKYDQVVSDLFSAACLCGLSSSTEVVACTDGGNGIREEITAQFPKLRYILDRPHAKSHLYETVDAMGLKEAKRERWVAHQMARLDGGDVQLTLDELAAHKGRGKARAKRLREYLTRFKDAVHYDAFRAEGLPIGSGEVESAHRTIPQKRLKLPGAWWSEETVNPMLALRVLRANGWWNEFWDQRTAA